MEEVLAKAIGQRRFFLDEQLDELDLSDLSDFSDEELNQEEEAAVEALLN